MILTFGKYRGKHLKDMPTSYLLWLLANDKGMRDWVRVEVEKEVRMRETK